MLKYRICIQEAGQWGFVTGNETALSFLYAFCLQKSNKMGNSLLAVRGINHKYIVVGGDSYG